MRIIDLSMTITKDHFRWKNEHSVSGNLRGDDQFQVTWLTISCHAFTHVDALAHILPEGSTIDQTPLDQLVGWCHVINLENVTPNTEITAEMLKLACPDIEPGSRILMRTCWSRQRSPDTPEFWLDAPFMSREACLWLLEKEIIAIAFDFPQDWPIRLSLKSTNEQVPFKEHVTHDTLLRKGVAMVEYLTNTEAIQENEVLLVAAPLKVSAGDGAPARVLAIEGLPREKPVQ